jgi:hypothetical protein
MRRGDRVCVIGKRKCRLKDKKYMSGRSGGGASTWYGGATGEGRDKGYKLLAGLVLTGQRG